jgi:hypothetical protein
MTQFLESANATWLMAAVVALLVAWLIYRRYAARDHLRQVLNEIGYDRIDGLIVPDSDDGEIQIDYLLLTSQGISEDRRYTFSNPQPALYDRVAAVKQIVRQVPVEGRVLFLDGAEFTKGTPSMVCGLDELLAEFGEKDKAAAQRKIEAFKPHWDLIRKNALGGV